MLVSKYILRPFEPNINNRLIRPNINNRFYIKGNKISTTRKRLKTLDVQFKSLAYRNQKSTSPQIILKIHELFLTHKTLDKKFEK